MYGHTCRMTTWLPTPCLKPLQMAQSQWPSATCHWQAVQNHTMAFNMCVAASFRTWGYLLPRGRPRALTVNTTDLQ